MSYENGIIHEKWSPKCDEVVENILKKRRVYGDTLKNYMWKWFTSSGEYTWIEIIPNLLHKYNNSVHRTIKMKPIDVGLHNEELVLSLIHI